MLRRSMLVLLAACAACGAPRGSAPSGAAADGVSPPAEDGCRLRVIAIFDRAPDDALLEDLTRVSGARLTLVRPMAAGLYLMELAADGEDDACSRALERLRGDERVRSADVDELRSIAR